MLPVPPPLPPFPPPPPSWPRVPTLLPFMLLQAPAMLLVDNARVTADALPQHPTLRAAAERFLAAVSAPLPPHRKLIYVCQGEEATCAADEDALLCSSDATTCLIAALVATGPSASGLAAAAAGVSAAAPAAAAVSAAQAPIARIVHHDEVTTRSLAALQHTVAGLGGAAARLWLAGAYLDERGTGTKVCRMANAGTLRLLLLLLLLFLPCSCVAKVRL